MGEEYSTEQKRVESPSENISEDLSYAELILIAFPLLGAGLVIFGLGVFGYQCFFWLQYGFWKPIELWRAWAWLGGQWPIPVGWVGLEKIIFWIFNTALSL